MWNIQSDITKKFFENEQNTSEIFFRAWVRKYRINILSNEAWDKNLKFPYKESNISRITWLLWPILTILQFLTNQYDI